MTFILGLAMLMLIAVIGVVFAAFSYAMLRFNTNIPERIAGVVAITALYLVVFAMGAAMTEIILWMRA